MCREIGVFASARAMVERTVLILRVRTQVVQPVVHLLPENHATACVHVRESFTPPRAVPPVPPVAPNVHVAVSLVHRNRVTGPLLFGQASRGAGRP